MKLPPQHKDSFPRPPPLRGQDRRPMLLLRISVPSCGVVWAYSLLNSGGVFVDFRMFPLIFLVDPFKSVVPGVFSLAAQNTLVRRFFFRFCPTSAQLSYRRIRSLGLLPLTHLLVGIFAFSSRSPLLPKMKVSHARVFFVQVVPRRLRPFHASEEFSMRAFVSSV